MGLIKTYVLMFFCRKYKTAVICRIRVIGVPLKRKAFLLRTLHADVPTLSLLITHYPKTCSFVKKLTAQKVLVSNLFAGFA